MKRYLLFDLDGTLIDPKVGITTCVQYALSSFGIQEPDLDKLEPFIGPPLKDSFMQFYDMSEEQAQAAVEKYRERFQDTGILENQLYQGIPEMLMALNSKGMFMAVASSKPTVFVQRILEHFQIAKYFKVVVGSELDGTRVNKDEVVEEALKQLFGDKPVEKDKVYMIGDRSYDIAGAKAQGVESVGVTYGYGSMEELKEARVDYIVRSVEELRKFLLRGTEDQPKLSSFQRIWQLLFPLLMFWLVRSLAQQVVLSILVMAADVIPFESFFFVRDEAGELAAITGNTSTLVTAVGFIAAAISIWKISIKLLETTAEDMKLLHIKQEPKSNFLLLGILAVSAVMGLNLLLELSGITQASQTYQAIAEDQYSANIVLGLISYGLITPFAEELLFRGVMYGCLRRTMQLKPAMLISAVLFGMYHLNSVQGMYGCIMGLLMVYAYEYFGDFKAALAIHIIANVLAFTLNYTWLAASGIYNWGVCAVFLALAAGSFWLLNRQKKVV